MSPIRSVYTKILLWCFATLLLSTVAMGFVSLFVFTQMAGKGSLFDRINILLLAQSAKIYESSGPQALAAHLRQADATLGGEHHLVDSNGKNLVSGEDESALMRQFSFEQGAIQEMLDGRIAGGVASADGRYRLLAVADSPFRIGSYLPYYLPIFAAVAILCWALAARIASPLRELARTVDRFGRGDLSARVNSGRQDEIGELGRAFDRMAERIGLLLTAERRLLQDISHELRTPLARLSFAVELLRTADDPKIYVAPLKKQLYRLTDLVGQLLAATQAESDPAAHTKEALRLDEITREVVDDCHLEAEARGCSVALLDKVSIPIEGYIEPMHRAIENIVRNAIRYAPEDSVVEVSTAVNGDTARVSVRDFGPGVPADVLDKIFQPFFRADDSRSSATGGVGLGLTITQQAVTLHRGRIWAENAAPGLRVTFEVPIAPDPGLDANRTLSAERELPEFPKDAGGARQERLAKTVINRL
jgi:two-component system sensor histidine kinase CpxA